MSEQIIANPRLPCTCPRFTGAVPQKRPLATFIFCQGCGCVRNRIMTIAFDFSRLDKHILRLDPRKAVPS